MKRSYKITIILGVVTILIISGLALTAHFRLLEIERNETTSGSEQNEKEIANQIAKEIINSPQNESKSDKNEMTEKNIVESDKNTEIELANPTSTYCMNNGGISIIKSDNTGAQQGFCKFPDGSECDEWQYFRGECRQVQP